MPHFKIRVSCFTFIFKYSNMEEVLVRKPEGRRPLEGPRHRWEDNIKMDLREFGWGAQTGLIWLRIGTGAGCCVCGDEPSGSIKCGEFL
jgi:hypothetical protein